MRIFITGVAGFIGFFTARRLCLEGHTVTGVDNLNDYYDPNLKYARLQEMGVDRSSIVEHATVSSRTMPNFQFCMSNVANRDQMEQLFGSGQFDYVIHLAAQAGVRYSVSNPHAYLDSNITGHLNILECCRHYLVKHLVYASSSSVYGLNQKQPLSESDNTSHPVSLYAATKLADEMMAHAYSHLFKIPTTGLRFFTVYGPWSRPDMALFKFTQAIIAGKPIEVNNNGEMRRDFTYIDDIVEGIVRVLTKTPQGHPDWDAENPRTDISSAPYRLFNIGNNSPVLLSDFIKTIEDELGIKARRENQPLPAGDVLSTWADSSALSNETGYKPGTPLRDGVRKFIEWYKKYYKV